MIEMSDIFRRKSSVTAIDEFLATEFTEYFFLQWLQGSLLDVYKRQLLSAADQGGASRCYDTECPGGDGGGGLALELRCGGSLGEWGVYRGD